MAFFSKLHSPYLILASALGLSACGASAIDQTAETKPLLVTALFSATSCNITTAGITKITDQTALEAILDKAHSHILNAQKHKSASVDFNTSTVYLVAMGSKPNSGYSLKLLNKKALYSDGQLNLPIKVELPSNQGMYAQMMTSPCLIVSLPFGNYSRVLVQGL